MQISRLNTVSVFFFFTLSNMLDFALIFSKMRSDSHILSCCSVSMHLLGRTFSLNSPAQPVLPTHLHRKSMFFLSFTCLPKTPLCANLYSITNAIHISYQTHVKQKLGEGERKTEKHVFKV